MTSPTRRSALPRIVTLLLLAACGGDAPTGPATPTERTLGPFDAVTSQSGTAGAPVATPPAVVVKTEAGAAVPGVTVRFVVTRGGGTVTGDSVVTGADGVARVGSWTLGTATGVNTLQARADGFTTVFFTAVASAGPLATLTPVAGADQSAVVGSSVAVAPAVKATDGYGNVIPGAVVTFAVTSGGGDVTSAVDTTDAQGVASVGGWRLGGSTGAQTLRATAGTVTGTFTATATVAGGCATTPYAIGATVSAAWEDADCTYASSGVPFDRYTFTATQQADFRLTVNGAAGRQIRVRRGSETGPYVAVMPATAVVPSSTNPVSLKYVFAPDTYVIEVAAPGATERSAYTLSTVAESGITCGTVTWWTPDVTVDGTLAAGDCVFQGAYEDWMLAILPQGVRIRTSLTSSGFRPVIAIKDDRALDAPVMAREYNAKAGTPVRAEWTTTYAGSHEVIVTTFDATDAGSYSLRIDQVDAANTCTANPFTIGNGTQAGWDASDCTANGRLYDRYLPASAPRAFRANLAGPAEKSLAVLVDGVLVGDKRESTTNTLPTHWFVKPGAVELRPTTPAAGTSYTLATIADTNITNCRQVFAQLGAVIPGQKLETTDCPFNGAYEDRILLRLEAGTTLTVDMTAGFRPVLVLRDLTVTPATIAARTLGTAPGAIRLAYTVATTGVYELIATSYDPGVTGSYGISLQ